jgi:hypothetical protein
MQKELKNSVEFINTASCKAMPTIPKFPKLVIFSYFTTMEILCKFSKLDKATRKHIFDNKESEILKLDCLYLLAPESIKPFDESYLIDFAPSIHLTLKCKGEDEI